MTGNGRVEIYPEGGCSEQVDDPNSITQILVTHNFLLNDFLFMQPNVTVHCVAIMNMHVRNYGWRAQRDLQEQ